MSTASSALIGNLTDNNSSSYINNVFIGDVVDIGSPRGTLSNNAFSANGAFGTNQVTGVVTTDLVDFVSPSTGDYTPTSTGKLADPAGTDLSAFFDDDITGTPR